MEPNRSVEDGDKIYFQAESGVGEGVLKCVNIGLVWRDYLLEDGRVIPEHRLLMCPQPMPWRDPDSVSEAERLEYVARIRNGLERANPGADQALLGDIRQYGAYVYLRMKREEEEPHEAAAVPGTADLPPPRRPSRVNVLIKALTKGSSSIHRENLVPLVLRHDMPSLFLEIRYGKG